jgi:DNA polymerase I
MRVAAMAAWGGAGLLQPLDEDGVPTGPVERVTDLAGAVSARESRERPRWVWASTEGVYPALLRAGVRVARCEDLALTEALLLGIEGRWGEPRSLGAAWARLRGLPTPADLPPGRREEQPALFAPDLNRAGLPAGVEPMDAVAAVHADQQRRIAAAERPEALRLLTAAESAGALAAAEMGHDGLPWRADVHNALLTELLGPRPAPGALPLRLRELADRISEAFGGRRVNPDSPAQVLKAFASEGHHATSTRSHVLRELPHPAAPLLLAYKELARVHAAHGWSWLDAWVRDGRFRPEYVPGGVVSGRWATRGGGALQIPKAVRGAVVADPGWALIVADASQLEPRILAALSGDHSLARAAGTGDLYAALAAEAFGGDRKRAKIALLSAIYGGTGGGAGEFLGVLRRRFPDALNLVETAARAGEEGRVVRSRLGRTCPPPSRGWLALSAGASDPAADPDQARKARQAARDRGRFTRNFVVQATAAEWALALLASLRLRLAELPGAAPPRLVFFQHDEVVVHTPRSLAGSVTAAVTEAAEDARRLLFGDTPVRFPLEVAVVDCYADAK